MIDRNCLKETFMVIFQVPTQADGATASSKNFVQTKAYAESFAKAVFDELFGGQNEIDIQKFKEKVDESELLFRMNIYF